MEEYALRLSKDIDTENPILLGLSFGGMMAVEIAKHIKTQQIILLASAKTRNEIPLFYRLAGYLGLHHLIPALVWKSANLLSYWFFGTKTKFEKDLFKQILHDVDPVFLKWAVHQIVHWQNKIVPDNVFHVHGNEDHVLPIGNIQSDVVISGGGHLMTLSKPEEIMDVLKKIIL